MTFTHQYGLIASNTRIRKSESQSSCGGVVTYISQDKNRAIKLKNGQK